MTKTHESEEFKPTGGFGGRGGFFSSAFGGSAGSGPQGPPHQDPNYGNFEN